MSMTGVFSAVLLRDGELVPAEEEERFRRVREGKKSWEAGRREGWKAGKLGGDEERACCFERCLLRYVHTMYIMEGFLCEQRP